MVGPDTKTLDELPADVRTDIDVMMRQAFIAMVKRQGGEVVMPVDEVDDTGGDVLTMEIVGRNFVFQTQRKS